MSSLNCCADIVMCEMKRTFVYRQIPVLTLSICYPKVTVRQCQPAQNRINEQIRAQVCDFSQYVSGELYRQAIATYQESLENDFPFHPYDAVLQYEITFNQHCYLSLYRDQYTFTGGAHGSTIRASDTWNLMSGCSIPMSDFFPADYDYPSMLIAQMIKQASENPEIFFEDYQTLIAKYFNEEHYFLTPTSMSIYYQQYEIAPYATGIVVFPIPMCIPSL